MSKFVYRLSAIIVVALAVLSISALRSTALSSDEPSLSVTVSHQPQAFPPWTFSPITSTVPVTATSPYVRELGENGEVFIEYISNSVQTYGLVTGGTLTPIFAIGQAAPGGGTFTTLTQTEVYVASPTLIYLSASVNDGGDDWRHYRWSNGTLTRLIPPSGEVYHVQLNDAHGKFVSARPINAEDTEYRITDGLAFSDPITLHKDGINDNPNTSQQLIGITADGAFLIRELTYSGSIQCSRAAAPDQPNEQTSTTRLFWLGSRTGNIVTGSATSNGCGGSGTNIETPVMNSAGDVLSREYSFAINPSGVGVTLLTTLRLYRGDGSGSSVVAQGEQVNDVGPYFFLQPKAVTRWRQPIFSANASAPSNPTQLYSGPNPAVDAFDGDFTQGFGQDGTPLDLYNFSETGRVLVYAQLANNDFTYALGSATAENVIEWIDPAGGAWSDAANWNPAQVPGQTDETLFKLDATYDITVSTRTSGRSRIEDGSVAFRSADLTLIGPLSIGGDGALTLPEGTLNAGEISIGTLPPTSSLALPSRLYVSNQGTQITGTPAISIGLAGPGETWLSDAEINSGPLVVGASFTGTAIIGGQHGKWYADAVAVGHHATGTLTIEQGGFLRSGGEVIIGNGATLQDRTAIVRVSNDSAPAPDYGNWLAVDTFSIGNYQRGELYLSRGGQVNVFNDQSVLQAGLRAHPGPGFDAFISIDGTDDTATITSTLSAFNDVLLGMADGAAVGVNITRGGQFIVDGADLFLGAAAGSEVTMTVAGVNAHTVPALLRVTAVAGTFTTGHCAIGESGTARLYIHSGGQVDCRTIRIGGQTGGAGYVSVDGANGGSTLYTEGGLCIGGDLLGLCGGVETGSRGTLELRNNASVSVGRGTLVGPGGRVIGSGDLSVGLLGFNVEDGGSIDPGVTILGAQRAPTALQAIQPGVLNIGGHVAISPTAVITLDVIGNTSSLYDRLIITGTANLGGKLVLNFSNGFAPQQGDSFAFMQAGAFAGSFQTTTIAGLAPGFTYTLSATGGTFNLVALNDGVPTTTSTRYVYLPLIRR